MQRPIDYKQLGSTSCSILPCRVGEHGVSWENMKNSENIKDQPDDLKHSTHDPKRLILDTKHSLWLKTLFLLTRWLRTPSFTAFMAKVEKL